MPFQLQPEEEASIATFVPGERRVSIFADTDEGRRDARLAAGNIGARIIVETSIAEGLDCIERQSIGDVAMVDVEHDTGDLLDRFLDGMDAEGRAMSVPVLVNSAPECIDVVAARMTAPAVSIMSGASVVDRVVALSMIEPRGTIMLREAASDDTLRLQRLADEVGRIARTLSDMAGHEPHPVTGFSDGLIGFRSEPVKGIARQLVSAGEVRGIIRLRRMRERFFRTDLFADPAWDMLLDLMAARLERLRVAVSSLCIAASVPPTTALRWIKTMTDLGLFMRVADPLDGRRIFIELSEGAAAGMTAYLTEAKGALSV